MKTIWDISPPVDEDAAVFPGDTGYTQRLHFTLGPGCPVNVHSLTQVQHIALALADLPPRVSIQTSRIASQSWDSLTALAHEAIEFPDPEADALRRLTGHGYFAHPLTQPPCIHWLA